MCKPIKNGVTNYALVFSKSAYLYRWRWHLGRGASPAAHGQPTDKDTLDELFIEMSVKRGASAAQAGFDNFRDYQHAAMMRYDYTPADCSTFHEAIEKVVVPLRRKLDEERREALGVDTLRPWDGAVDTKGRAPLRPFKDADELVEDAATTEARQQ